MNEYLYGLIEDITGDDVPRSPEPLARGDAATAIALAAVAQELRTANKIARLDMLFRYMDGAEDRHIAEQAVELNDQIRDELDEKETAHD